MSGNDANYSFKRGYPTPETIQRAYNNADLNRAIQVHRFFAYGSEGAAFDGSWKPVDLEEISAV